MKTAVSEHLTFGFVWKYCLVVGHNSRDLAAAALYDAGLLRPPASATNDDPAKATGVLLVEANAPDEPRFTFDDWKVGKATQTVQTKQTCVTGH